MEKFTVAEPITVKEIQNEHSFTVGKLKKALANLDDDMIVTIHRVEDSYFGKINSAWKTIKTLWEINKIGKHTEKRTQEWMSDTSKCDRTLHELEINENGQRVHKEYIDAIPVHQAIVSKEKGPDGKRVLLITPHY